MTFNEVPFDSPPPLLLKNMGGKNCCECERSGWQHRPNVRDNQFVVLGRACWRVTCRKFGERPRDCRECETVCLRQDRKMIRKGAEAINP